MILLLIDNYDSFTYNLAHLFGELGAEVVVRRNDEITADEAEGLAPSHLVVSPGPGRPEDAGVTPAILRRARRSRADARRLPRPPGDRAGLRRRGRTGAASSCTARRRSSRHDGRGIFAGLPGTSSRAATTRSRRRRVPDVLRGLGDGGRRRGDGRAPPRAAGRRRPVPSRVGADAARAATSRRNFLGR